MKGTKFDYSTTARIINLTAIELDANFNTNWDHDCKEQNCNMIWGKDIAKCKFCGKYRSEKWLYWAKSNDYLLSGDDDMIILF
jgi:hypothetical protein